MRKRILSLILAVLFLFTTIIPHTTVQAEVEKVTTPDDVSKQLQGSGTETDPWLISDVNSLHKLLQKAENGFDFKDCFVKLTTDIVVNDVTNFESWTVDNYENLKLSIWTGIKEFDGTFDGGGHSIIGLYILSQDENAGFIKNMDGGKINNLCLSHLFLNYTANENAGALAGIALNSNVREVTVSDARIHGVNLWQGNDEKYRSGGIGGIVGKISASNIENCSYKGSITIDHGPGSIGGIGGIVGTIWSGDCSFAHTTSIGTIEQGPQAEWEAGGVLGSMAYCTNNKTLKISDCQNQMNINGLAAGGDCWTHRSIYFTP